MAAFSKRFLFPTNGLKNIFQEIAQEDSVRCTLILARRCQSSSSAARHLASSVNEKAGDTCKSPYTVGTNLHVYEATPDRFPPSVRPLTLMFSWLNAKRSHVDKYASVYQREGVDVVHVFMTPRRLMVGSDIEKAVEEVLGYVTAEGREQRPLLVHGISVGGLIYTELVATILAQQQKQAVAGASGSSPLGLQQRIKGTVMDSIVDVHHAPRGISRAVTTNSHLRRLIVANIDFQMNRVFRSKFERMREMSALFHDNPCRYPTLMLNSHADEVGSLESMRSAITRWREKGITVVDYWWNDSKHAAHIRQYPLEYASHVINFMRLIGLLDGQVVPVQVPQNHVVRPLLTPLMPAY